MVYGQVTAVPMEKRSQYFLCVCLLLALPCIVLLIYIPVHFIFIVSDIFTGTNNNEVNMAVDLRSCQKLLPLDHWFQRITFCFRGQQAEREDDMFYEEDEIYGEEHEEWPCLEW